MPDLASPPVPRRLRRLSSALTLACAFAATLSRPASAAAFPHLQVSNPRGVVREVVLSTPSHPLPAGTQFQVVGPDGQPRPTQRSGDRLWWVEPSLPTGNTRYQVEVVPTPPSAGPLTLSNLQGRLEMRASGRPVISYFAGPGEFPRTGIEAIYRRGGYLHHVTTPAGRIVTDDYPPNHTHHHGIWSAWTKTVYGDVAPDFWNMGQGKGRVDFTALDSTEAGPVFAGFTARHQSTDLMSDPDRVAVHETWNVRAYRPSAGARFHLFDLHTAQSVAGSLTLQLPTYHYGGVGYRGPWAWNGKDGLRYLDSNGETNRVKAHGTRARWFWVGGMVDGALAGVVMWGHPGNFRAPQPLRVHPDEPFICWAPSQLGDWAIRPGEVYRADYRVAALDGEPDPAVLEAVWFEYAEPPRVEWTGEKR